MIGWHLKVSVAIVVFSLVSAKAQPQELAVEAASSEAIVVESVVLRLLQEADISTQEAGILTTLHVRDGDRVEAGRPVAQIDDAVAKLAVRAAELAAELAREEASNDVDVRYAQKAREVAIAELGRSQDSIAQFPKSVSQSQIDVERLTVEKTTLEQEQAEHESRLQAIEVQRKENDLLAARLNLERRQIVAPFDGVIVEVHVRLGEWVEPGQKVARIINVDRLKAEGFVSADAAAALPLGAAVQLKTAKGSGRQSIDGRLVFVSPEVDPINNQVRVWAEVENSTRQLRPGQRVEMAIMQSSKLGAGL